MLRVFITTFPIATWSHLARLLIEYDKNHCHEEGTFMLCMRVEEGIVFWLALSLFENRRVLFDA